MYHECKDGIEKSVPQDHCLLSLGYNEFFFLLTI